MIKTCKRKLGLRNGRDISLEERKKIIEEYLSTGCSKQSIWKKYTGQREEHGQIIKWMRALGYTQKEPKRRSRFAIMSEEKDQEESFENLQLKKRITELEQELKDAKMKAIAYSTMVDIAEEEFKIKIRKKYNTKPSK